MPVETFIESSVTIRIPIEDASNPALIRDAYDIVQEVLDSIREGQAGGVVLEVSKPRIVRKRASPPVVRSDDEVARGALPVESESSAAAIGSIGGKARAEALSPERRSEIASIAARARWDTTLAEAGENGSGSGVSAAAPSGAHHPQQAGSAGATPIPTEARKATEGASAPVQQSQDGTETETHYSDGFPKIPAGVKRKA